MSTATVYDLTPGQLQRSMRRPPNPPPAPPQFGVFADMADGVIVTQFLCNFAGFDWHETKLFVLIAGLCGDGDKGITLYDKELAEHARCTDRTIRSWRAAYLNKAQQLSFWPLQIKEGEYNAEKKRYERAFYAVSIADTIEQAVAAARAMPAYASDRLQALEQAASEYYDDIPDAPAKRRTRKPKKSLCSPVIRNLNNAARSLDKGKEELAQMPARMRAALLAGEGEHLRALLLKMRSEVDELLSAIPQGAETTRLSDTPEKLSGTPLRQPEASSDAASDPDEERLGGEDHFREEAAANTRKSTSEATPSPEAEVAWEKLTARLNHPQVRRVEVPLCPPELPVLHNHDGDTPENEEIFDKSHSTPSCSEEMEEGHVCPSPEVDPELIRERLFIMVEDGGLSEEEAARRAQRDLCERCHAPP